MSETTKREKLTIRSSTIVILTIFVIGTAHLSLLMLRLGLTEYSVRSRTYNERAYIQETTNVSSYDEVTTSPSTIDLQKLYSGLDNRKANLWDNSTAIPQWMKEYLQWHHEQMIDLNSENWQDKRFLVMQCLKEDKHCGGTSDRIQPMPSMLQLANQTNRILLILWNRPYKLENFLLPPQGGLDWRVPEWLEPLLPTTSRLVVSRMKGVLGIDRPVVMTRIQQSNGGADWFDEPSRGTNAVFDSVYHDLWRVLFTPVPQLAAEIQNSMKNMNLNAGQYTSAHVRALYLANSGALRRSNSSLLQINELTTNALNCASRLNPSSPIYFASDSKDAATFAQQYGAKKSRKIATIQVNENPIHLDEDDQWQKRHPSEYYATFRDLYLLGFGNCATYGVGAYGLWGLRISGNYSCGQRHDSTICQWTDGESEQSSPYQPVKFELPMGMSIEGTAAKDAVVESSPK